MNYCPQCGKPLPIQDLKFCPECGCNLSSQKAKDYDVICPDCDSVITDENSACPICGCPPDMFTRRAKAKLLRGEALECPECGMVFVDTIPAECPNCACPSKMFVSRKTESKVYSNSAKQKKGNNSSIWTICIVLLLLCGGVFFAVKMVQQAAERTKQEQYAKERNEQERVRKENEERENRERKKADERFLKEVTGVYMSQYYNFGGNYVKYRITLNRNETFKIESIGERGHVLSSQSGKFKAVSKQHGCVLNPGTNNSSWIEVVSSGHLKLGDIDFY